MNLAVKLYEDETSNPDGFPGYWPSQVLELGEDTTLPEGAGWELMTSVEYASYLASHQEDFDIWNEARMAALETERNIRQGIINRMNYGESIILDFREKTMGMDDMVGAQLLIDLNGVINALYLGTLQLAAYLLTQVPNETLDEPYDEGNPEGPTLREYYAAKIAEGDPT